MVLMAWFTNTTDVTLIDLLMKNLFVRTYFYLSKSLIICDDLWKFLFFMRISPYSRSTWESLSIYDHHENLSLFMIIYENHFFMKTFIICEICF